MSAGELRIPLRTYHTVPAAGLPRDERHFRYQERGVTIPVSQAALVLVDVWDSHYIASDLARTAEITQLCIKPVLAAARRAGVTVVHAPSPPIARKYPQWTRYAGDHEIAPRPAPQADWPPLEFRRREGAYAAFARPLTEELEELRQRFIGDRHIDPNAEPQSEDFVIATGDQLHRLCRDRQIMHLIYAGYNTNMCIPFRDYGVRAFRQRGYHVVLLRDCTTAIEGHDTVESLAATAQAIRELEIVDVAPTTTADALITACAAAGGW